MEGGSENQNLQWVSITSQLFLLYIILTYIVIQESPFCPYNLILFFEHSILYPQVLLLLHLPATSTPGCPSPKTDRRYNEPSIHHIQPTKQPDGLKVHFHFPKVLSLLVMLGVLLKLPLCPQDIGALKLLPFAQDELYYVILILCCTTRANFKITGLKCSVD